MYTTSIMRFARRTDRWAQCENAVAVAQKKARARGPVIDLTCTNPTAVDLAYDTDAILDALRNADNLKYEPRAFGDERARNAIATYYTQRGIEVLPEDILVTASTSEAYLHLFRAFVDPGDRVACPSPTYPLLEYLFDLSDAAATPYNLSYDGRWHLNGGDQRVDEQARACVFVSPNNPTGSVLTGDERTMLAARFPNAAFISDEVFADFATAGHASASLLANECRRDPSRLSFSLNGLSKVVGLPQIKLAWIVVQGSDDLVSEAKRRLEVVLDTFLSVSAPATNAAPKLLALADDWQEALRARLSQNRRALIERLHPAARMRRSDGGWVAIVDLPRWMSDEMWAVRLAGDDATLVHPGYFYDIDDAATCVVSLLPRPDRFEEGVCRLNRLIERTA